MNLIQREQPFYFSFYNFHWVFEMTGEYPYSVLFPPESPGLDWYDWNYQTNWVYKDTSFFDEVRDALS